MWLLPLPVSYLRAATVKADGRPPAPGLDKSYWSRATADGNQHSCFHVEYPFQNHRRNYYEFKFDVPPLPYEPQTITWLLVGKIHTGNYQRETCIYPGLTVFIGTQDNPDFFTECVLAKVFDSCMFHCWEHSARWDSYGGQSGARLFVRLELPVYGDWPIPKTICEIETEWQRDKHTFASL